MKQKVLFTLLFIGVFAITQINSDPTKGKYLIILQAGMQNHEGMARAVHALLYSQELIEHGYEVVLVFDGAGTEWINEWNDSQSQNKLKTTYDTLKKTGITQVICDHCATAFQSRKNLELSNIQLMAEYHGHPSIAKWVDEGYQIVIL